jgi:transposase, IS5 family
VHGFKAHVGADADTPLVEEISDTSANINDGKPGPDALPDNPGEVLAGSAYRVEHFRERAVSHTLSPQPYGAATNRKRYLCG